MADYTQATSAEPMHSSRNLASMANWAGAAISLALLAGVGVWGYKLLVRDISGVPVVQAAEGPMRVAPENPGGHLADHQGLAVNDVAGTGLAAAPADRLVLAPSPIDLADEDVPVSDTPTPNEAPAAVPASDAPVRFENVALDTPASDAPEPSEPAEPAALSQVAEPAADPDIDPIQALANQIAAGVTPLGDVDLSDTPAVVTEIAAVAQPAFTGPGLARSLRPKGRPLGATNVALSEPAPQAQSNPREVLPDALPEGTRLVQLGAYDSEDAARSEWTKLEAQFGEFMAGKDRVIQQASSGGRTFFRLRAVGFDDVSDARRFCAAFVAEGADCIPVVSR